MVVGKKFDVGLYVVVASFKPLQVREGRGGRVLGVLLGGGRQEV